MTAAEGGHGHSHGIVAMLLTGGRQVECLSQTISELDGIVDGPEMHEEQTRLVVEQMIVQARYLDSVFPKRTDYRIHLRAGHHEIAGDGCLAG